ncbi:MAG: porin [Lunatimonas sp.]|uniref:outer membrane beta-barrel protein n=1 Tax=Lunatimonas sp. TaxID=2060141 RepID=UPI00263B13FB|nr:outer membrane beta-barrel protein [Lunatimonas sp.]MCC5938995.1 porin [Lunatimonas sp.]
MAIKRISFLLLAFWPLVGYGQDDPPTWTFAGYIESYYLYDFGRPENHERPDFLYNFKRHNEFSVNLALLGVTYQADTYRANVKLMSGNYAQYNLAEEPTWAQFIYEASAGVRLYDKVWLDMGVMPSHIGFESAIGADCWHLSRSLLAENSPYFLTGVRVTYEALSDLDATLWLTNGWQNVQRTNRNQSLGIGIGLNYHPSDRLEINYANYLGNEYPQPLTRYRFFQNFYLQRTGDFLDVTIGFDHGTEQKLAANRFNRWFGVTASMRTSLTDQIQGAIRAEYYADPAGVILSDGLKVSGFSLNLDYHITQKAMIRVEGRRFISPEPIFNRPLGLVNRGNSAIATSLAIRID